MDIRAKKRRKKKILNWVFFGVLVIVVAVISINAFRNANKETKWTLHEYQASESVYTGDLQMSILASAVLQPFDTVDVRPEASGRIEELYVDIGDWIEEGDPIALLDQESLLIRLDTAEAQLASSNAQYASSLAQLTSAQAQLVSAGAQLDLSRRGYTPREVQSYEAQIETAQLALNEAIEDLDHERELHAAGFGSDEALDTVEYTVEQAGQRLDQAQAAYDVLLAGSTREEIRMAEASVRSAEASVEIAEANVLSAEANILMAEASVTEAENSLGDATIYSPMTGIVLRCPVTEGTLVVSSLSSYAPGDNSILTIGDLSSMKAYASVDENDIGSVKIDQICLLDVDAYGDEEFEGIVLKIHPEASPEGGTTSFTAEIEVPNPDGRLMSGMSCEVEIVTEKIDNLLLVPDRALAEQDDKMYVFVVNDDDSIEAREVEVGKTNYEATEVISGLEEGEEVIVRGVPRDLLEELEDGEDEDDSKVRRGPPGRR